MHQVYIKAQNYYSTSCTSSPLENVDFTLTQPDLQFILGNVPGTSQSVGIDIINESIAEDTETFSLSLSFTTMSILTLVICPDTVTVTITDDDGGN